MKKSHMGLQETNYFCNFNLFQKFDQKHSNGSRLPKHVPKYEKNCEFTNSVKSHVVSNVGVYN